MPDRDPDVHERSRSVLPQENKTHDRVVNLLQPIGKRVDHMKGDHERLIRTYISSISIPKPAHESEHG